MLYILKKAPLWIIFLFKPFVNKHLMVNTMKKSYFIVKLAIFIGASFLQIQANGFEESLDDIEKEFDRTQTVAEKYAIVSRPIPLEEEGSGIKSDKTCAFALAISLGRPSLVAKFLSVVENVNSENLMGYGYRQGFFPTHLALDPQYPKASHAVALEDRLAIIDMLGRKKADFNRRGLSKELYLNPPLAAGWPSGRMLEHATELRARALLYGADPSIVGTSFPSVRSLDRVDNFELVNITLQYFMEKVQDGEIMTLRPVSIVMDAIKKRAAEKDIDLDALIRMSIERSNRSAPIVMGPIKERAAEKDIDLDVFTQMNIQRSKLNQTLQQFRAKLATFKSQKTRNAKSRASHISTIIQELVSELQSLDRKSKRITKAVQVREAI